MYFKRLEISGFKSFLNRTRLKFEPGVTAVVGPNGCGKSNVVDAIKWVLGEQSTKSMRSTSMQDVIFNGTEKHEPVNLAEVSLTLSNEDKALPVDYDEVTITRRVYRSGESEYLLNKTPVRLLDIRNLLMGTGIGTSSYSIVEQGRMDMILSSKPEDRRYVFEEASGITRYKTQKREALLKLEKTRDNLLRINDIIREVERQINSIERKARKAERYKARFDELKDLEIKLSVKKFRELGTDDSSLAEENRKLKENIDSLSSDAEGISSRLLTAREEYNSVTEDLNISQNEVMRLSTDMDKNTHTVSINRERVEEFRKQVERLDWEIEQATERKDRMGERLSGLETRFKEVEEKRQNKDEAFRAAEENIKILSEIMDRCSQELKASKEMIMEAVSEQTRARNALIRTGADTQNSVSREKRLKTELAQVLEERSRVEDRMKAFEDEMGEAGREMESKREEYRVFSGEYSDKQKELAVLFSERASKEKKLNEIVPRREFLEKLISEREGMGESVKEIMRRVEAQDALFSGVAGILSEMISFGDNYEESVRAAIGEAAYSVVVDTAASADAITGYLAENSMESVNFLILDEIERFVLSGEGSLEGSFRSLSEIMTTSFPKAESLKAFFGDILVASSREDAARVLEARQGAGVKVIGEKGELYSKGFRRSRNYSSKESVPLFGRKEKAASMAAEEKAIAGEITAIEESVKRLETWLVSAASSKEKLERELRDSQARFSDVLSKRSSVKEKFDSVMSEISVLETEIKEETANLAKLEAERVRLEEEISSSEGKCREIQGSIDKAQETIKENSIRREETLFCMSDLKAELSALRKDEENLADNLERERSAFARIDSEVEDKRSRITESAARIKSLEEEIVNLEAANAEFREILASRGEEIAVKKERKESLLREVESLSSALAGAEGELEKLRDKARDVNIMKKEIEYKKSAIQDKISDTYKVDIAALDVEIDPQTNWDEVSSLVEDLKGQIEKMGDVSLGAMEEHKQLEERFRFLTKQRDDLESSREQLLDAIQKINRTTRKKFMDSFEAIRKEFNDYFRMLFNGGKADLILEDERDVLESGIDIVVRPPGKKLHNIMQLSGGEKAMTAIALIFAIFKVNPSPFCVLDEIDAPLDESNVVRFCRVLQEFLKLSQFVIITHNRMTIQLADVLYGITMQEKGVSKMVSVKFGEEKEVMEETEVGAAV
ncbi:MAG TPA: chromosome segregation protein SMC [Candidatus Omnitrophota bacterium]|nr:chromosome segregation protein SMC [Candidatus Omnitrophota bacterium]